MKGIQQGTKQHNRSSKKRKLSPKGKMNSSKEFIPRKGKVIERPTPPWGRFISPRENGENDAGRFRERSLRKTTFSLRGKFTPLNGKIVGKVNSLRIKAGERHVYHLKLMFPKGGPISPRYKMKFTKDNFTSPRGRLFSLKENIVDKFTSLRNLERERHVFLAIPIFLRGRPSSPRKEAADKEKHVRYIIPLVISPSQRWHVVQHKFFSQRLSRT